MNPIKNASTVSSDGSVSEGGSTSMSGFTIVEAQDLDTALGMAKSCPFLEIGGSLEVSEMINMSGS